MVYNFDLIKDLTKEDILSIISEEDIYNYYLGYNIKINKLHKCCFHKDNTPSLGFYESPNKNINFRCFGCGESGNVFNFVMKLHDINYYKSLKLISNDFKIGKKEVGINIQKNTGGSNETLSKEITEFKIYPKIKLFNKIDFNYWNPYYLDLSFILGYNVNACENVYYRNKSGIYNKYGEYSNTNPLYSYKIGNKYKIYRPLNPTKIGKWFTDCGLYDVQGLEQLSEKRNILFITSSLKDVMVLKVLGYEAVAPHGEGMCIPSKIMDYLFATSKQIIIFYDNDKPGIEAASYLSKQYNIKFIYIPIEYIEKDISDFIKKYGILESKKLIKNLISRLI